MKTLNDCKFGDTVYIQKEYHFDPGIFLKLNKKSVKVRYLIYNYNTGKHDIYDKNEKIEKVAHAEELVAVVCEQWKNGPRSGHRLDKTMYSKYHRPAKDWPNGAYLYEKSFGVVDGDNINSTKSGQKTLKKILNALKKNGIV